uniref:Uncharacterized protein n=1 Tax=Anguilla anguilla TaxID=7936 RepID=A0A0E9PAT3_ANGAN
MYFTIMPILALIHPLIPFCTFTTFILH